MDDLAPFQRVECTAKVDRDGDAVQLLFGVFHVFDELVCCGRGVLVYGEAMLCYAVELALSQRLLNSGDQQDLEKPSELGKFIEFFSVVPPIVVKATSYHSIRHFETTG